jgi:hypothetical protein
MKTRRLLTLSLLVGLLLAPMVANAQDESKPLTWLSYLAAQTGKGGPLGQYLAENGAKIYDPLMAEGHVVSWGVAQPINHNPGDEWTHVEWVTFSGWAAVDAFMQAFMGAQMAKSPEQLTAEQEKWHSLVVPGSHFDEINRHQVIHVSAESRPAYFNLGYHSAKPGQGEAVQKLYEEYGVPVLSELQAAGTIGSFGMSTAELHGGSDSSHLFWYSLPSLGAREAVDAAFEAAAEKRGAEAQGEVMAKFAAAVDFGAHHDRILLVTHLGGAASGEGDDSGEE